MKKIKESSNGTATLQGCRVGVGSAAVWGLIASKNVDHRKDYEHTGHPDLEILASVVSSVAGFSPVSVEVGDVLLA